MLTPHQSNFRTEHSTISNTSLILNYIVPPVENRMHCAALFVDFSKAFDTVNHSLLLQRLSSIGIDPNTFRWFKNYLSDREQSEFLRITKGILQGATLRPVLFTIYINNIVMSL